MDIVVIISIILNIIEYNACDCHLDPDCGLDEGSRLVKPYKPETTNHFYLAPTFWKVLYKQGTKVTSTMERILDQKSTGLRPF